MGPERAGTPQRPPRGSERDRQRAPRSPQAAARRGAFGRAQPTYTPLIHLTGAQQRRGAAGRVKGGSARASRGAATGKSGKLPCTEGAHWWPRTPAGCRGLSGMRPGSPVRGDLSKQCAAAVPTEEPRWGGIVNRSATTPRQQRLQSSIALVRMRTQITLTLFAAPLLALLDGGPSATGVMSQFRHLARPRSSAAPAEEDSPAPGGPVGIGLSNGWPPWPPSSHGATARHGRSGGRRGPLTSGLPKPSLESHCRTVAQPSLAQPSRSLMTLGLLRAWRRRDWRGPRRAGAVWCRCLAGTSPFTGRPRGHSDATQRRVGPVCTSES